MKFTVITPPEPFVTPADVPGDHASDDVRITALIAAATAEIDGYSGWLGRCLGPQEVEVSGWFDRCSFDLPIGPILELVSFEIEDANGNVTVIDPSLYRLRSGSMWVAPGASWIPRPVHRIRYWAGYGVRDDDQPDTWKELVPANAKQAVVLAVLHLNALSADNLFLRSEDVEGVGVQSFTVSEQAGNIIRQSADRLLSGLKVYRV